MAVNTIPRDYDLGRIIDDYEKRISFLERLILQLRILFTPGTVYDTGWVAVPAAAGFTSALFVRRIGHSVALRGTLTPTVDWGAAGSLQTPVAVGSVPVQFRTPVTLSILGASGATSAVTWFRIAIQSNGAIQVRCSTAAHTNSVSVNHMYFDS